MSEYWQIAAGKAAEGRDYSDLFLKYGMAFFGGDENISTMESVSNGDIVILKEGLYKILAAGTVVERNGKHNGNGDKKWLMDFDGWYLPAYCYVDWKKPDNPIESGEILFSRTTITRSHNEHARLQAENVLKTGKPLSFEPEPKEPEDISVDQLLEHLVYAGLSTSSADDLTNTILKIRLLGGYYCHNHWDSVGEHEARTFLVIPLLLALGWSEQQLKIEYSCETGKVDIACFRQNYNNNNEDCVAIIETKGLKFGLNYAPDQAVTYLDSFPNCRVVVVTNGHCYKIYEKSDEINKNPVAFLNMLNPTMEYPLDPRVGGALDAIEWLLPNRLISKTPA